MDQDQDFLVDIELEENEFTDDQTTEKLFPNMKGLFDDDEIIDYEIKDNEFCYCNSPNLVHHKIGIGIEYDFCRKCQKERKNN